MINRERKPEYDESNSEFLESTFERTDTDDNLIEMARQRGPQSTSDVKDDVKERTGQIVEQARLKASANMSGQMNRAADGLGSIAHAVRNTGQQLRTEDKANIAGYADMAADQVEWFSTYLRDSNFEDVVREVEQMARRQPLMFLGGAFIAGFLGARFLKSSSPHEDRDMYLRRGEMDSEFYRQPGYGMARDYGTRPSTTRYGTPSTGTPPATPGETRFGGETTETGTTRPLPPSEHLEKTDEAA